MIFRPDPTIYDGRFANNGWLQELPKPVTKLTWDNAAIMSPATAGRARRARPATWSSSTYQGNALKAPVFIQPGHADGAVTLHLGYGRTQGGPRGHRLWASTLTACVPRRRCGTTSGWTRQKTAGEYLFATTQNERIARHAPRTSSTRPIIEEYQEESRGSVTRAPRAPPKELNDVPRVEVRRATPGAWRSTSTSCTGCSACVIGLPVAKTTSRWSARTRCGAAASCTGCASTPTTTATANDPEIYNQPVPCMQCENAPCELVCPVQATSPQLRRPERHGVQPLRRHALLLQQLPVQGAALQFLPVSAIAKRRA